MGPVPVPERVADCWLPVRFLLLSVTVNDADRLPTAAGVNVTLTVQLFPAPRVLGDRGQVVVSPKSPGLVPVNAMLVIVKLALPVFVRVIV